MANIFQAFVFILTIIIVDINTRELLLFKGFHFNDINRVVNIGRKKNYSYRNVVLIKKTGQLNIVRHLNHFIVKRKQKINSDGKIINIRIKFSASTKTNNMSLMCLKVLKKIKTSLGK